MALRDGLFVGFSSAMLVVALAPRRPLSAQLPIVAVQQKDFSVTAAWLAQRESALGDWEDARRPLREGDELQLTVMASQDADVYVLDGERRQIFPPPGAPPSLARVRAHWPYAVPGPHRTWRLDAAQHDRLCLVVARHPLSDPAAALDGNSPAAVEDASDLPLPLRDGRPGHAPTHHLSTNAEVAIDCFNAR